MDLLDSLVHQNTTQYNNILKTSYPRHIATIIKYVTNHTNARNEQITQTLTLILRPHLH